MPLFLTKHHNVQEEITNVLPVIACMTLGSYSIILNHKEITDGHTIFSNAALYIAVTCAKCYNLNKNEINPEQYLCKVRKDNLVLHTEIANVPTLSKPSTVIGLRNLFAKFLNSKQYTDIENCGYWDLLKRLSNHFYVFKYGVSSDIMTVYNCHHISRAFRSIIETDLVCMNI